MAELPELSPAEFVRQARQHLESLKAAGLEWLPSAAGIAPAASGAPAAARADSGSLFGDPGALAPAVARADGAGGSEMASAGARRQALKVLAEEVSRCSRCPELAASRTQTVFGVGAINPELCFVGEAPGADEDRMGEPFVGAAGQLLNKIITACGMKREEVYICNILKCRPPGNRLPLANEAANCRGHLEEQLKLIGPKYLCALGACAAQNLLNTTLSIGKLRGRFHDYRGIPLWCTYHPAYLLRNPSSKKDVWEDMKKLLRQMGRPVP